MAEQTYIQILDPVNYSRIIVLHGADNLVFVLYNMVHLNNNNIQPPLISRWRFFLSVLTSVQE